MVFGPALKIELWQPQTPLLVRRGSAAKPLARAHFAPNLGAMEGSLQQSEGRPMHQGYREPLVDETEWRLAGDGVGGPVVMTAVRFI